MLDLFGEEIQEREKHRDWSGNQRGVFSVMDSYYIEDNELHDASLERLLKVGRDGMTRKEKHNLQWLGYFPRISKGFPERRSSKN